jgi:hypothetical protein
MIKFKHISLVILILLSSIGISKSQYLHIGARGVFTPVTLMDYYDYNSTDYTYYFSNDRNETWRFSGFELSTITSYVPAWSVYLRYDLGNHVFFQTDLFSMRFNNEAKYDVSVNYSDFIHEFDPEGEYQDLEYNKIKLRWRFLGNSLTAGVKLLKAKRLRPFLFIGVQSMYLMGFEHRTLIDQARVEIDENYISPVRVYNDLAFKNLDTFEKVTFHYRFGFGLKYHGFTWDLFVTSSIPSSAIDIYDDKYIDEQSYDGDISLSERANYLSMYTFNSSISLNIFSFNTSKKHIEF